MSGWGVVFASNAKKEVREALAPLLAHRRVAKRHIYSGRRGVLIAQNQRPAETKNQWYSRQRGAPAPADPDRVPYYLLLVGSPRTIPFEFQFRLGLHHAVGRIYFKTPEEYRIYAESVIQAETKPRPRPRRAVLFGVQNQDDSATRWAVEDLVRPIFKKLKSQGNSWKVDAILGQHATKKRLVDLIKRETPTLLFTSSHGMGFHPSYPERLGALVCSDWPGPKMWATQPRPRRVPPEFYFAASDIPDVDLSGLICFFFACYSAGIPRLDSFTNGPDHRAQEISPASYLSPLPQKLLAHSSGGALAVLGHVDRARGYSYQWPGAGPQPDTLTSVLWRLMEGRTIGYAARYLSDRYGVLTGHLNPLLLKLHAGEPIDDDELADFWTATMDARGYLLFGDPAVRLQTQEPKALEAPK